MSLNIIQATFDTLIYDLAESEGWELILENQKADPTVNHIMPFILPTNAVPIANTTESTVRYTGVYQVSLFQKKGTGTEWYRQAADKIIETFRQGKFFDNDCIRIKSSYVSSSISYNDLFMLAPITINYDGLY
jgi:hypothetical protein